MRQPLDFPCVANNAKYIAMSALNPDGTPVNITGISIKWQYFKPGSPTPLATKKTSDGTITIVDAANGLFSFWLNATDTVGQAEGEYIHEAVTVDGAGHPVTITNNDPKLTAGRIFLRQQYTVQD